MTLRWVKGEFSSDCLRNSIQIAPSSITLLRPGAFTLLEMEYIERKIVESPQVAAEYTELGRLYDQK